MSGRRSGDTDPKLILRAEMLSDVRSGEVDKAIEALLTLTFDEADRKWVEKVLLTQLNPDRDIQVRSLAVTCLGHLARLHGKIGSETVSQLTVLRADSQLRARIEDALDDIAIFAHEKY